MSYATEAAAIRTRFNTEWKAAQGFTDAEILTRVKWPNKTFTPPNGLSWVALEILPAGADQTTMGGPGTATFWYDGLIAGQVFVPDNAGDGAARTLAEQFCVIFRSVEAGGIIYDEPYTNTAGSTGNGWYQVNVWAPYRRKTTH